MPIDLLAPTDLMATKEPVDLLALPPEKEYSFRQDTIDDGLRSFFGADSEKEKTRAANAMTYAEMLGIAPSVAYDHHDEISQQINDRIANEKIVTEKKGFKEAISSGFDTSIVGMMGNQKVPEGFESVDQFERWTHGLVAMGLDLPIFLGGMALGGGPTTPTGWAGGFGLNSGVRQVLIDRYSKGEAKSFGEFAERTGRAVKETVKGQIVGGLTGIAGSASPIGYKALSELATMTVAGKFIEGEIPTARDLVDNAAILLAMHVGISGLQNVSSVKAQLQKSFVEDGIHPKIIVDKLMEKPIQDDLSKAIDDTVAEIKKDMPAKVELAPEKPSETPPPVASTGTTESLGQVSIVKEATNRLAELPQEAIVESNRIINGQKVSVKVKPEEAIKDVRDNKVLERRLKDFMECLG